MPKILRHSDLLIHADRGVLFHTDESLARAVLAADAIVDGVPCARDEEIEFHRHGRLAAATLACDAKVRGLPARAGSPLAFHGDGAPRFLVLAQPRRLHGIPVAPGSLFLHPDGSVANALTAGTARVDGVEIAAGTRVTIGADGRLREFWSLLQVDSEIRGLPCSARYPVWRWRDGGLSCAHLARPCVIDGRRLPVMSEVLFDRDGVLRAARRARGGRAGAVPWRIFGADEEILLGDAA